MREREHLDHQPAPGQRVEYADGATTFEAYVAAPPRLSGRGPCVLLAHDWSGLNRGMRRVADRLAAMGYVCFALDLYGKGVRGDEAGDNSHLMMPLLGDRALVRRRLIAGLAAAITQPQVDAARIAVIGYCFGGLCALDLVRAGPREVRAAACFHAPLSPPNLGPQRPIGAKVLVLHGWEDPMAPPEDVVALARELTEAGADWQLHAYGHAMHGFTFAGANFPERGIAHNPAADRRSWSAMTAFLAETLSDRSA